MNRIQEIVRKIAATENGPTLLRDNPRELSKKLQLDPKEMAAIFSGDLQLIHAPLNPLAGTTTYTFYTGSTITGNKGVFTHFGANTTTSYTFETGSTITGSVFGPSKLEDLEQQELIQVINRALNDNVYADRLKNFLNK